MKEASVVVELPVEKLKESILIYFKTNNPDTRILSPGEEALIINEVENIL